MYAQGLRFVSVTKMVRSEQLKVHQLISRKLASVCFESFGINTEHLHAVIDIGFTVTLLSSTWKQHFLPLGAPYSFELVGTLIRLQDLPKWNNF